MTAAAQLLDAIVPLVRTRCPRDVGVNHLDDFLDRNRVALEAVIEQNLGRVLARVQVARARRGHPRFWTVAKRTAANIAAMATAQTLYAQRRTLNGEGRPLNTSVSVSRMTSEGVSKSSLSGPRPSTPRRRR